MTWLKWKLDSVHLERVLILTQDWCTICVECTIGWKSFWTHPMDLLGDVGHVESRFSPFGDSVSVDARYMLGFTPNVPIGSEIVLDAPVGTPR